nr:hypothetical protein [Lachnospiraceae bacterium]
MKKEYKVIIAGGLFIFALAIVVFTSLNKYMDGQTESDVRSIGKVYLQGIVNEELEHFNSIKTIRFTQINSMVKELQKNGTDDTAGSYEIIKNAAEFQDLASCALFSEDGSIETVYGPKVEKLGDESYLRSSLKEGKHVVTGGWDADGQQLVIYAAPIAVKMTNGTHSMGLLWCKTMTSFSDLVNLDDENSLVYFHLVRRNGTYVIRTRDSVGESFFDKMTGHSEPIGMSPEAAIEKLKNAINTNSEFEMHTIYTDENTGIKE